MLLILAGHDVRIEVSEGRAISTLTDDKLLIKQYIEKIQHFRLLDDTFFNSCLQDNIKGMELMLRIIMKRSDLRVVKIINQNKVPNIYGREACFDVFVEDRDGKFYDVEVQRSDNGAMPKRARYNSSMIDAMAINKGAKWEDIPRSCVIMITENDVLGGGWPIYHIRRTIKEMDDAHFDDASEIIYVNASLEGDDDLGRLMHDFHCTDPDEMYYQELAERVRFFKTNEKGVKQMCKIMQEILDEGIKVGRSEGEDKMGRLVERLVSEGHNDDVARVAIDKAYRAEMYQKYSIE